MPFDGYYEGELCGVWEIPAGEDVVCKECGDVMRVWRESERGTARHLKHIENMGGGDTGGSVSHHGSCGESEEHVKWKNMAAERLSEVFGEISATRPVLEELLAAPTDLSDANRRRADAVVYFENWDEQLGRGLAVEVQHKNKNKDKKAVRLDYDRQDIAVVWLDGDDFNSKGCLLNEVDFRQRAFRSASIADTVDFLSIARSRLDQHPGGLIDGDTGQVEVPAKLPAEFFDKQSMELWRSQHWDDLFSPPDVSNEVKNALESTRQTDSKKDSGAVNSVSVALPLEVIKSGIREHNSRTLGPNPSLKCSVCGYWTDPYHPESAGKLLSLHAKSEHKNRVKSGGSYRQFFDVDIRNLSQKDRTHLLG